MIDSNLLSIESTDTTLDVTDIAGNDLSFGLTGWDPIEDGYDLEKPIDGHVSGRLSELRYPLQNVFWVERLDGEFYGTDANHDHEPVQSTEVNAGDTTRLALPAGQYLCRLEQSFFVYIRFDGSATITNRPGSSLVLSFPHPTTVSIGFKTSLEYPRHELTIEPTTRGIATALSHMSASISTISVDRVHRNYRGYPPLISVGEETVVPPDVVDATPDTGIELRVPDRLEFLFPAAPLAYYLGATVTITDEPAPVLAIPNADVSYEFDPLPAFEHQSIDMLRRVFFLDMLTSWVPDLELSVVEATTLEDAGIDLKPLFDAPIASRLEHYLSLPAATIDSVLPPWPYRMTVEPNVECVAQLPHLLNDMAAIELPNGGSTETIVSTESPVADELHNITRMRGSLSCSNTMATDLEAADETASFVSMPSAYENRLRYLSEERQLYSVVVVFARSLSEETKEEVIERYARRDEIGSPHVRRLDDPNRSQLREAFREGADFLQFVGHADDDGLHCRDGVLEPASLSTNNVQLFQLETTDGSDVALNLIETGSVAGVVATPESPDSDRVPTLIGELVLYGQSIATAAECRRRLSPTPPSTQTVVGDGAHRFSTKWLPRPIHVLEPYQNGERARMTVVPFSIDPVGAHWYPNLGAEKRFQPAVLSYDLETADLIDSLDGIPHPIYFAGRCYWPEEHQQLAFPVA
ncbi:hypothetical protein ACLI4Q_09580 [Natrialbaceae archaeon A-CW1-1]